jgi:hypothetical protein
METPVVRFRQRNNLARLDLTLHPDYAEYNIAGSRGKITGFNVKYESLPKTFDYRTFRAKDRFVTFPLILIAGSTLFQLATNKGNVYSLLGARLLFGLVCCGIGYGLRCLLKKDYTALATAAGTLLIAKDGKHDQILAELQTRRAAAQKKFTVINPLAPPWNEIKKFKWLRDEGVISDNDFRMYRKMILSSAEPATEKAVETLALH